MKNTNRMHIAWIAAGLAVIGALGTAALTAAYWTDRVELEQTVSAYDLKIQYEDAALAVNDGEPFYPGAEKDIRFTVVNTGDLSVDIKPQFTLTSALPMVKGGSEFLLLDENGQELTGYTREYRNGDVVCEAGAAEACAGFTSIVYTLSGEDVLSGTAQTEASAAGDGTEPSKRQYRYRVKLSEKTENSFMGNGVRLDVSTYAIQHRGRAAESDGIGSDWIKIVQTDTAAGGRS